MKDFVRDFDLGMSVLYMLAMDYWHPDNKGDVLHVAQLILERGHQLPPCFARIEYAS